jgi:hypothetical protein
MSCDSFGKLHRILGIFQRLEVKLIIAPYTTLQDTKFRLASPSRVRLLVFLYQHMELYIMLSQTNSVLVNQQQYRTNVNKIDCFHLSSS